jgi:hypothetical protein
MRSADTMILEEETEDESQSPYELWLEKTLKHRIRAKTIGLLFLSALL